MISSDFESHLIFEDKYSPISSF